VGLAYAVIYPYANKMVLVLLPPAPFAFEVPDAEGLSLLPPPPNREDKNGLILYRVNGTELCGG